MAGLRELRANRSAYRLCNSSLLRKVCLLLSTARDLYDNARVAEPPKVKLFPSQREIEDVDVEDENEEKKSEKKKRPSSEFDDKLNIVELDSVLIT